ncbi:protein TIPIN homolog [Cephus cinctus]|uniref:TIMELESS-interacting protein n=1 Tax=Cephus cinctus TaxID=211228 RepID=A0AAJ7BZE6_CEPCN|nr:protein TIPIN homolog [Cephus cinctus]
MEIDIEERDREYNESEQIDGYGSLSDGAEEESASKNDEDESNHETKRRIDPSAKPRTVRNPQPKLNTELLKGPKGVHTIEKYFEGFKYNGKGHEKHDLNRIMKRLEHWAHRLYPRLQFDDFLEKVAILEKKKDLQVHVKKYRLDMLVENDDIIQEEMDVDDSEQINDAPVDEFDLLLAEQIAKQKQTVVDEQATMDTSMSKHNTSASGDPIFNTSTVSNTPRKDVLPSKNSTLSEEMKQRIERNRQLAIERRSARMKMRVEKTEVVNENIYSTETTSNNTLPQITQEHVIEVVTTNEITINSDGNDTGPLELMNSENNQNCEQSHIQNPTNITNEESTSVPNDVGYDSPKENENVENKTTDVMTSNKVLTSNELKMEINAAVHELVNSRKQKNE